MKQGDNGSHVAELQKKLNDLGTKPQLVVDGDFGPKTAKAVIKFQKKNGLLADGIVGEKTMALLGLGDAPPVDVKPGVISSGRDADEGTAPWYRKMFSQCSITKPEMVKQAALKVLASQGRYLKGEQLTGVPWWFLGAIHYQECRSNFKGCMVNGEAIIGTGRKTTIVPKGRGPYATWEESCVDAMKLMGYNGSTDWELGVMLGRVERYNGTGYIKGAGRSETSPYLWAGTNVNDGRGRYVADGHFDPNAKSDLGAGVCAILKYLQIHGYIALKIG